MSTFSSSYQLSKIHTADRGVGVKADAAIPNKAFVIEYIGERISFAAAEEREEEYSRRTIDPGCYMFYCKSGRQEIWYSLSSPSLYRPNMLCCLCCCMCSFDATEPSDAFGLARYVNHSFKHANLKGTITTDADGDMHLCFFAKRDIAAGEELLIDYGDRRKDVVAANRWLKDLPPLAVTHTHTHTHTHGRNTHTHTRARTHTHNHIHTHLCVCVCMYV